MRIRLFLIAFVCASIVVHAQDSKPLPDIRALINEVAQNQKKLEKIRENYTYNSAAKTEDLDSNGQVKKTETSDLECFFVSGHPICREVKKDGKPLSGDDAEKESKRVTKLVEKAQKTPPDQPLEGVGISISKLVDIMDVSNPRRIEFRGRTTIVFDFVGRKDAKTSGVAEDMSKKLKGTLWVDEEKKQVSHAEATFIENFNLAGGLVAKVDKGSHFAFDQSLVNGEIWLPTGVEGTLNARVLLFKGYRQHFVERMSNYQRFKVDAEQQKSVTVH